MRHGGISVEAEAEQLHVSDEVAERDPAHARLARAAVLGLAPPDSERTAVPGCLISKAARAGDERSAINTRRGLQLHSPQLRSLAFIAFPERLLVEKPRKSRFGVAGDGVCGSEDRLHARDPAQVDETGAA